MAPLRKLLYVFLFLLTPAFGAVPTWNGVAITAWNASAITALNGVSGGGGGGAGLAVDSQMASATGSSQLQPVPTLTYSFTNTAGTLLVVGASYGYHSAETAPSITGITYNGFAMTKALDVRYDSNFSGAALYYLASPATGAHNVVVTMSGSATQPTSAVESGAISFTGADPTTPIKATFTNHDDGTGSPNPSTSATSTTAGNILLSQLADAVSISASAQTVTWTKNVNTSSAGGNGAMAYTTSAGGTVNMSYTAGDDYWGMVVCEIAKAP